MKTETKIHITSEKHDYEAKTESTLNSNGIPDIDTPNRNRPQGNNGLFIAKSANEWIDSAKTRPVPKMLFSELWFEGEICFLFADTNLGKSILAVQIGDSISIGTPINGFKLESCAQPILYFDFELSDKQFENRYSVNFSNHYRFNSNFVRVEINPDAEIPAKKSFEDHLIEELENEIIRTNTKILIIDNLTYLKNETEHAKNALPLMKKLKLLKQKYDLSILVLAHTPKRDNSKPITKNDLAGSKMLMNFCDSAFAIGECSKNKTMRYLKQTKARSSEVVFDAENIILCKIIKPNNFLQFKFIEYGIEYEYLKQVSIEDRKKIISDALELSGKGYTNVAIGKKLGISEGAVRKYKKKYSNSQDN